MTATPTVSGETRLAPTYKRPPIVFTRGEGAWLEDSSGRRYLDALAGIAVNALGHADPETVSTMREAAGGLIHVSNLFHTEPHLRLAETLCAKSFADRVFFCNSGTEAIEGALKFARLATKRHAFVAFHGSFHGRTMGALSVTSGDRYRAPFEPLVPGVTWASFDDPQGAVSAITAETAAVIVEPIQGEGGIRPAPEGLLRALRQRCDETGALLVFDEIQCGLGRTGDCWAHEATGVTPDIMTLAKPLGAGLPIGAILMRETVATTISPGDHGSTFAGGPFICSVANVVLRRVTQEGFLARVREAGARLGTALRRLDHPCITEVRGRGLMWGVQLREDVLVAEVVQRCLDQALIIGSSGGNTVRLVPPLIVTDDEIDIIAATLDRVLGGTPR
ncbi:MAG: acetylornithine/succinylornithine family transaminase [Proteobacteria bacterium]|nr:acetylornithine/succinylornithine family transaminase [Pseudomonadota bacterium]